MQQIMSPPLKDDELERLGAFLEDIGTSAMNLEMLDGFFAALICGPDRVLPSEYLPHVFGKDHRFDSNDQVTEILGLVIRHWNTIASKLALTLEKEERYCPVLFKDAKGIAHGNDWARGFMRGVRLRPEGWSELVGRDDMGGPMLPIMMLEHEHDADLALRFPEIKPEFREELLQTMWVELTRIYRYFAPHRSPAAPAPLRRQESKVGRSDPCPCGSGRKFKHCCAVSAPTLH